MVNRLKSNYIFVLLLFFGALTISGQIILIREFLIISNGNELIISIVFCFYLLYMALGSWVSGQFVINRKKELPALLLFYILLGIIFPLSHFMLSFSKVIFTIPPVELISFIRLFIIVAVILAPFCTVSGCVLPLCIKILSRNHPLKNGVSLAYIFESIGAGVGTLIISIFLFPKLQPVTLSFLLASCCLFTGFLVSAILVNGKTRVFICIVSLIFSIFYMVLTLSDIPQQQYKKIQWQNIEFLDGKNTKFGYLDAIDIGGQTSIYANGDLLATAGYFESANSLVRIIHQQIPEAENILLVGGALNGFIHVIQKFYSGEIDYVEMNNELLSFAKPHFKKNFFDILKSDNLKMHHVDERTFITKTDKRYDIIVINKPSPSSISLNRFYSYEFFAQLNKILKKDGIVVFEIESSSIYLSSPQISFLSSLRKTLLKTFQSVIILPGETSVFLISKNPSFNLKENKTKEVVEKMFSNYLFRVNSPISRDELSKKLDKVSGKVKLNRDLFPIAFFYNIRQELTLRSNSPGNITKYFISIPPLYIYLIPILFFFTGMLLKCKRYGLHISLFAIGLSGMSYQIIIMFLFQIIYGFLFFQLGILTSCFMFGLAMGSGILYIMKVLSPKKIEPLFLKVFLVFTLFPLLLYLFLIKIHAGIFVFNLFSFIQGLLSGFLFTLSILLWRTQTRKAEEAKTGKAYALDLAGAGFGALLTAPVILPQIGLSGTIYLLFAFNLISLFFCWMYFRMSGTG